MNSCLRVVEPSDWLRAFRGRVAQARIPFTAHLELTRRCNLRCRHCYLGEQAAQHAKRALERDSAAVKASLAEWVEAGCLHLVITGGEPLLRADFPAIYRQAAELGLRVTVFSNGTLVSDAMVDLFRELPPRSVELSIYGATAATYESVTGSAGSYDRAWEGIRRLLAGGVRVVLKTVMLTLNRHEVDAMAGQAAALGCRFRVDAAIFPCLSDRSQEPLQFRVAPETAVQWELTFPDRRRKWAESILRWQARPVGEGLYFCGAGNTAFHADPFGNLSPCLMTVRDRYPQGGRPFRDVWRGELGALRKRKRGPSGGCHTGALRGVCTHCPASNYLETGDEERDSDYMKKTAEIRYAVAMAVDEHRETER